MKTYSKIDRILFAVFLFVAVCVSGCAHIDTETLKEQEFAFEHFAVDGVDYTDVVKFCEFYDISYEWDGITRQLVMRKGENEIKMMADAKVVVVDEVASVLDAPVLMRNNRLICPLNFIEEIIKYISNATD